MLNFQGTGRPNTPSIKRTATTTRHAVLCRSHNGLRGGDPALDGRPRQDMLISSISSIGIITKINMRTHDSPRPAHPDLLPLHHRQPPQAPQVRRRPRHQGPQQAARRVGPPPHGNPLAPVHVGRAPPAPRRPRPPARHLHGPGPRPVGVLCEPHHRRGPARRGRQARPQLDRRGAAVQVVGRPAPAVVGVRQGAEPDRDGELGEEQEQAGVRRVRVVGEGFRGACFCVSRCVCREKS